MFTLVGKDLICSVWFHLENVQIIALVSLSKDFSVKIYLFWLKLIGKDLCTVNIIGKDLFIY